MIGLTWRTFFWVLVLGTMWSLLDSPKAQSSQTQKSDCELEILWAQDSALGINPYDRRGRPDNTGKCREEIKASG